MKTSFLNITLLTTVTAVLSGLCITAHAESQQLPSGAAARAELKKRFTAADIDGDGKLTREEAKGRMALVHRQFDAIDTARTSSVTLEQIEAHAHGRRARP